MKGRRWSRRGFDLVDDGFVLPVSFIGDAVVEVVKTE